MEIRNKKISIIGAVRSGIAAANLAKENGAIPFVSDSGSAEKLSDAKMQFDELGIEYEFGSHTDKVYDSDFIVTSPGVPSDAKVLQDAKDKGIEVFSEVEFASWFCKAKVAAITGSNGKTTTTALLNHVINESGFKCYVAGNIGDAFAGVVSKVTEDDYVSLETSSFQLDHIKDFRPNYAMILNITPDHLDRYENSFENYKTSKLKIYENQNSDDCLILNADDMHLNKAAEDSNVQKFYFSTKKRLLNGAYLWNGEFIYVINGESEKVCDASDLFIKGEHNYANALAVLIVAKKIGLSNESIAKAFSSFEGVEHRLEFVREINGIKFINDSKATNVDSVWYALNSFEEKILLILGGKDKGNDYDQIKDVVKEKVRKIYAIGSSKEKVYEFFKSVVDVEKKETLQDCITAGLNEAEENEVVLLSPACASFDMFNNYEHRGEVFKEAVMELN